MADVKLMDINEFMAEGYLQEANRMFFHPLGLALQVTTEDDGTAHLSGVWDYRDDSEGIYFEFDDKSVAKARNVEQKFAERRASRLKALGFVVQPVPNLDG